MRKGKTSNLVDAGGYNGDERDGNWRLGMGRQRGLAKENKFTLGIERCENIKNLCINEQIKFSTATPHVSMPPKDNTF
jgi:hypothetical protein